MNSLCGRKSPRNTSRICDEPTKAGIPSVNAGAGDTKNFKAERGAAVDRQSWRGGPPEGPKVEKSCRPEALKGRGLPIVHLPIQPDAKSSMSAHAPS